MKLSVELPHQTLDKWTYRQTHMNNNCRVTTISSSNNNNNSSSEMLENKLRVKVVHQKTWWIVPASNIQISRTARRSCLMLQICYPEVTKSMRMIKLNFKDQGLKLWQGTHSKMLTGSTRSRQISVDNRTDWPTLGRPTSQVCWLDTSSSHQCQRVNRYTALWTMKEPMDGRL